MNTKDLIKLAEQADYEGDYELADYIDNKLVRTSAVREAQWWKALFGGAERGALEAGEKLQTKVLSWAMNYVFENKKIKNRKGYKIIFELFPG